jgi:hypothetical protein
MIMYVVLVKDLNRNGVINNNNDVIFHDVPIYQIANKDDEKLKYTIKDIKTKKMYVVGWTQTIFLK